MIDSTYDRYTNIVYSWLENTQLHSGPRIYHPRHEIYTEDEYYVIGIESPNFLEPKDYNPENDLTLKDYSGTNLEGVDVKMIVKMLCASAKLTLDELCDLNTQLKAAGAKEVQIHPAYWEDKNGQAHIIENEWLIVIPKD